MDKMNSDKWELGAAFLPLARALGYSASFFNLVFVSNDVR